jgi:sn-glycerol 3-phosphate transport system ATP-binding protein
MGGTDWGLALPARVAAVEYLGADSIISTAVGGAALAVRVPGTIRIRMGETVRLTWRATAQHLFDVATGRRVEPVAGDQPAERARA